jgi:membrane-associated phospholipid phosphatase
MIESEMEDGKSEIEEGRKAGGIELFHRLPRNVVTIFSGGNLGWHALAIGLTAVMVMSGGDWSYYLATRNEGLQRVALPAIALGSLLPIVGPLVFLLVGAMARERRLVTTGWALGQAALVGYLIASTYKAFTGRIPPPWRWGFVMSPAAGGVVDTSHGFQFGFLRGGIFWGWPSSHTTIAFATTVCLATLYPKNKPLVCGALLYAFYVGLSVSVSIHWCSEFVAGAIIGSVIGIVVGKSFKAKVE